MKNSKSSLFLMELIIAILFFSIASAICIQLFAKSHLLGRETTENDYALLHCQNFSEIFLGLISEHYDDSDALLAAILDITEADDNLSPAKPISSDSSSEFVLTYYFDENWNPTIDTNGPYMVQFKYHGMDSADNIYMASTTAFRLDRDQTTGNVTPYEMYHLNVSKHIPERME